MRLAIGALVLVLAAAGCSDGGEHQVEALEAILANTAYGGPAEVVEVTGDEKGASALVVVESASLNESDLRLPAGSRSEPLDTATSLVIAHFDVPDPTSGEGSCSLTFHEVLESSPENDQVPAGSVGAKVVSYCE